MCLTSLLSAIAELCGELDSLCMPVLRDRKRPTKLIVTSAAIAIVVAGLLGYLGALSLQLYQYSAHNREAWQAATLRTWADFDGDAAIRAEDGPGYDVARSKQVSDFDYLRSDNYRFMRLLSTYQHNTEPVLVGAATFALLAISFIHVALVLTCSWRSFFADHTEKELPCPLRLLRKAFWFVSEDLWENGQLALVMVLGVALSVAGGASFGWELAPPLFAAAAVLIMHWLTSWSDFKRLVAMELIEVLLQVSH